MRIVLHVLRRCACAIFFFFFFQAEDGIRDLTVTGVQTCALPISAGALAAYKNGGNGAHFLIDKDGAIYQTARVNQRTFHVGNIQSRCHNIDSCSVEEANEIKTILKGKGTYSQKVKRISDREKTKAYPDRYPTNADSLGIEVVGKLVDKSYEKPTAEQDASVKWLVAELLAFYKLTTADVYRHPQV